MGAPAYDYLRVERLAAEETQERKLDASLAGIDCKVAALGLCSVDSSLRPVRGFAVFRAEKLHGFTEHWWCIRRNGVIVDVTTLRSIVGGIPQYVPLEQSVPMFSTCDALDGPCQEKSTCAWCKARKKLVDAGLSRVRIAELSHRVMLDKLFADNAKLREELASELIEKGRDVIRCKRCGGASYFGSIPSGYAPIQHSDYCPLY